jgi:hypothetical protein
LIYTQFTEPQGGRIPPVQAAALDRNGWRLVSEYAAGAQLGVNSQIFNQVSDIIKNSRIGFSYNARR